MNEKAYRIGFTAINVLYIMMKCEKVETGTCMKLFFFSQMCVIKCALPLTKLRDFNQNIFRNLHGFFSVEQWLSVHRTQSDSMAKAHFQPPEYEKLVELNTMPELVCSFVFFKMGLFQFIRKISHSNAII